MRRIWWFIEFGYPGGFFQSAWNYRPHMALDRFTQRQHLAKTA
jgi:hypothetical protein